MLTGLVGICVGTYALLDQTAPRWLVLPGPGRAASASRRSASGRRGGGSAAAATGPTAGGRPRSAWR